MLVKRMLRLCHLLVIRLSCSAHLCAQLHFPLLSQHRVCNVLLDPSLALAGICSCGADIPVREFGVCRHPSPRPTFCRLCALRLKGTTQHSGPRPGGLEN